MKERPSDLLSSEKVIREKLSELSRIEQEIERREASLLPTTYGLPDLLRPQEEGESDQGFINRQNKELREFVEGNLKIHKDGKTSPISLFPEIERFISDTFYGRVSRAILWKGRGCGGSVAAAVSVFLCMVFRQMSFINMSGSQKQAKAIYDHVSGFWDDLPEVKRAFLKRGHPLKSRMECKNGVKLDAVPASEKQARHQHVPGLVLDEAAQPEGSEVAEVMQTALEGTMSEENHLVLVVSTFHEPSGFFADTWDFSEARGFNRYKFSVFDSMRKCTEGIEEYATETDPLALKFCRNHCPLTERIETADEFGNVIGEEFIGCHGQARTSKGFQSLEQVIVAKNINVGTDKFEVEFACHRPVWKRSIYNPEVVEEQQIQTTWEWAENAEAVVGVDWGFSDQSCCLLIVRGHEAGNPERKGLCVIEAEFLTKQLVGQTIMFLRRWMDEYGLYFLVYADSENAYNNRELEVAGFDVESVSFNAWKEYGINNVSRWFGRRSLYILEEHRELVAQLKGYRRSPSGKPVKKNDHGPDALLAAMLHFPFIEEFAEELGKDWSPIQRRRRSPKSTNSSEVFLI